MFSIFELREQEDDVEESILMNAINNEIKKRFKKVNKKVKRNLQKINNQVKVEQKLILKQEKQMEKQNMFLVNQLDRIDKKINIFAETNSTQLEELEQYKKGYSFNIMRDTYMRIIRCIDNIDGMIKDSDSIDNENLKFVKKQLEYILYSCGIDMFSPEVGSLFKGKQKRLKIVEKRKTNEHNLSGIIFEVYKPGYYLNLTDEKEKIIKPAEVGIYI